MHLALHRRTFARLRRVLMLAIAPLLLAGLVVLPGTAAILDVAFSIARDLRDIRALSSALAGDLVARANSEGQTVDLMHAHARAIVLTYGHALGLARSDAIAITRGVAPDIVAALGIGLPRAMADAISRDLASAIDMAHSNAVEPSG